MSKPKCARCKTNDAEGFLWIDGSNCCGTCVGHRPMTGFPHMWTGPYFQPTPAVLQGDSAETAKPKETRNHSHYYKPVGHLKHIDWYRVADLFEITCPALAHAGKKIAFAGKRGAKDQRRDIQEAIDTLLRKLQMMDEDEKA